MYFAIILSSMESHDQVPKLEWIVIEDCIGTIALWKHNHSL